MPDQKIGKYRILEAIGRGGMGTIFKAHDPVLDRLVALKVISPEVDVTDELRARFFREAQACAKLNHPNIVTVYELGEDDGRLFIVMELLEGQELRRLIVPDSPLTLEDKVAVMVQVCGGLHYAHQKGIVHRDMKPGNVFLLGNGQVKILDFGIAHMATTEVGLTRTGLIMGTLRYISPEQVRGRADFRSDMFSVGSVFYELLTLRPPFTGNDPMRLLEELQTREPPSPSELDAAVPAAVTAIVQRAMRKNPAERFRDLDEMRLALEQVQRGVVEERSRVAARARDHRDRVARLRNELAAYAGAAGGDDEIPPVDERKGLGAIQALERDLAARVGELEARLVEAKAAAEREIRRARQDAEGASKRSIAARAAAEAVEAAAFAPQAWNEAQVSFEAAQASWRRDAYADARAGFDRAEATYRRAGADATRAAEEERRAAEEAREAATEAQQRARAADAVAYARELWEAAETKFNEARATFGKPATGRGRAQFTEAAALYRRADQAAHDARDRERRRTEAARARAAEATQFAPTEPVHRPVAVAPSEEITAPSVAPAAIEVPAAVVRPTPPGSSPVGAATPDRDASSARPPRRLRLAAVVGALVTITVAVVVIAAYRERTLPSPPSPPSPPIARPESTTTVSPPGPPPPPEPRNDAEGRGRGPSIRPGDAPVSSRDTDRELPPRARPGPDRPIAPAIDAARRRPPPQASRPEAPARPPASARQDADRMAARVAVARRAAEGAAAGFWVPRSIAGAQGKERLAATALDRADYGEAVRWLEEAEAEYRAAAERARTESEAEQKVSPLKDRVRDSRAGTTSQRAEAVAAQAPRLAKDAFDAAEAAHREADDLDRRQDFAAAAKAYEAAAARYRDAARRAQAAREPRTPGDATRGAP